MIAAALFSVASPPATTTPWSTRSLDRCADGGLSSSEPDGCSRAKISLHERKQQRELSPCNTLLGYASLPRCATKLTDSRESTRPPSTARVQTTPPISGGNEWSSGRRRQSTTMLKRTRLSSQHSPNQWWWQDHQDHQSNQEQTGARQQKLSMDRPVYCSYIFFILVFVSRILKMHLCEIEVNTETSRPILPSYIG